MQDPGFLDLVTDEARADSGRPNFWGIIETIISVIIMGFIIYSSESFLYTCLLPFIAPLFFLKSPASANFSFGWFSNGIKLSTRNKISKFIIEYDRFEVIIGYIIYIMMSFIMFFIIIFLVSAKTEFFFAGSLFGFLQFFLASASVVAVSILLGGLGKGGVEVAGGIAIAVRGTYGQASYVFLSVFFICIIAIYYMFGLYFFLGYIIGAIVISFIGAVAGYGVVRTIAIRDERTGGGEIRSGADPIRAAIQHTNREAAAWKAIGGGFFYFPGMTLGFFVASFIIRFIASAIFSRKVSS